MADDYASLKRTLGERSLIVMLVLAAFLAAGFPVLGFDVAFGAVCGATNLALAMRGNEALLDGRRSVGTYVMLGVFRICLFSVPAVIALTLGPWWGVGFYFAGFFGPLTFGIVDVHRRSQRRPV